jgi:hypothetical protein
VNIRARLRRLETRVEAAKRNCPCGGPNRVAMCIEDEPDPPPCPKCGTSGVVIRIVRCDPPEGWAERWADLANSA